MRKIVTVLFLAALAVLGAATPALAHQHINPSGTCPAGNAHVPQGSDNPGGQTPGGRNNAADVEQGTKHCANG